jgi:hypothetical protein
MANNIRTTTSGVNSFVAVPLTGARAYLSVYVDGRFSHGEIVSDADARAIMRSVGEKVVTKPVTQKATSGPARKAPAKAAKVKREKVPAATQVRVIECPDGTPALKFDGKPSREFRKEFLYESTRWDGDARLWVARENVGTDVLMVIAEAFAAELSQAAE